MTHGVCGVNGATPTIIKKVDLKEVATIADVKRGLNCCVAFNHDATSDLVTHHEITHCVPHNLKAHNGGSVIEGHVYVDVVPSDDKNGGPGHPAHIALDGEKSTGINPKSNLNVIPGHLDGMHHHRLDDRHDEVPGNLNS